MSKLPTFFLAVANLTEVELSCQKKSNFCSGHHALIAGDVLHTGYFQTGSGLFCWKVFHQILKGYFKESSKLKLGLQVHLQRAQRKLGPLSPR